MTRPAMLFPVGALILSAGVDRLMREGLLDPMPYFARHARGDWGQVDSLACQANDAAVMAGERIESLYVVTGEISIHLYTLADRSATHVVLAWEV